MPSRVIAAEDEDTRMVSYIDRETCVPIRTEIRDEASGGRIKLEQYDPDTSTVHKNEADDYGIRAVPYPIQEETGQRIINLYGSVVLIYRDRESEVLDIAANYRRGYEGLSGLEYEISSRLWQLSNDKPTLGLTGYLVRQPQMNPMNPMKIGQPQQHKHQQQQHQRQAAPYMYMQQPYHHHHCPQQQQQQQQQHQQQQHHGCMESCSTQSSSSSASAPPDYATCSSIPPTYDQALQHPPQHHQNEAP